MSKEYALSGVTEQYDGEDLTGIEVTFNVEGRRYVFKYGVKNLLTRIGNHFVEIGGDRYTVEKVRNCTTLKLVDDDTLMDMKVEGFQTANNKASGYRDRKYRVGEDDKDNPWRASDFEVEHGMTIGEYFKAHQDEMDEETKQETLYGSAFETWDTEEALEEADVDADEIVAELEEQESVDEVKYVDKKEGEVITLAGEDTLDRSAMTLVSKDVDEEDIVGYVANTPECTCGENEACSECNTATIMYGETPSRIE